MKFFKTIINFFKKRKVEPIHLEETIARFVFSSRDMSPKFGRLKHRAFSPPPKYPNEVSVFRINGIAESMIWCIGQKYVGNKAKPPRTLKGRGDLDVKDIVDLDLSEIEMSKEALRVEAEPSPHERHANIHYPEHIDSAKLLHITNKLSMLSRLSKAPENVSTDEC